MTGFIYIVECQLEKRKTDLMLLLSGSVVIYGNSRYGNKDWFLRRLSPLLLKNYRFFFPGALLIYD